MSKKPSVSSWSNSLAPIGEDGPQNSREYDDEIYKLGFERQNSVASILRLPGTVRRNASTDTDQGSERRVAFVEEEPVDNVAEGNGETTVDGEQDSVSTQPVHNKVDHLQPILMPLENRRPDSTGRLFYMKKINETMAEQVFIVDSNSNGGIFPKLMLDQRTVQRNILNKRKATVFQHVAKFHHKFGIRHYMLIGLLALYSVLGGLLFLKLEAENEMVTLENNIKKLEELTDKMALSMFEASNVTVSDSLRETTIFIIKSYYLRMLKVENRYLGSAYHKFEMIDQRLTWNYGSAVFYAMTLFTTIGYGSIACQTTVGKALSIVYATIGIPIMLVVLSDIGKVLLHWLTYAYNGARRTILFLRIKLKKRFAKHKPLNLSKLEDGRQEEEPDRCSVASWTSEDELPFPMWLTVPIVIVYLLLCSAIVCGFDYDNEGATNLSFGDSFYFSFFSLSTIGLGDVLPNKIEYSPFLALMFLGGLALLSVVNTTVYETMENKLLEGVTRMEIWLESVHYYRHGREGYFVFKSLTPNLQLLALALPLFDDCKEQQIEAYMEPANRRNGRSYFAPTHSGRTRSLILADINNFRPTLGIMNMNSPRRKRATTVAGSFPVFDPSTMTPRRCISTDCSSCNDTEVPSTSSGNRKGATSIRRIKSDRCSSNDDNLPRIRTLSERVSEMQKKIPFL
ncbi:TWiK family of potassium channels protein 18 [Aphelenchoides besseyi]|nr:TWiK family of potassium channels protein 18 [Aphelenchoides besseyi]